MIHSLSNFWVLVSWIIINFFFQTRDLNSNFAYIKNYLVSCENDSCPWSIHAICSKRDNVWKITKCKGLHTCLFIQVDNNGQMIDLAYLPNILEQFIWEDPLYSIMFLCHIVLAKLKHHVSHYKVWNAKQKVVATMYRDFKESYAKLPHFLARLKDASLGLVYKLLVHNNYEQVTCTFSYVFWVFGSSIGGFKHYKPMISIDATHLYGEYKGKWGFVFPLRSEEVTEVQKGCSQYELHLLKGMGEREMGFNIFLVYKLHNTRV